jgi:mannose/fructose/N-acetylgalactosamine-specific phosphotransferase system component IIB
MNKFGTIKSKVLQSLTESYAKQDKEQIKEIITTIKKDKNFKEMYLFYEEFENKYIESPEDAALYLEEIRSILYDKPSHIKKTCKIFENEFKNIQVEENELYSNLDAFIDPRKLQNIDKRIIAKKKLIEHLTTKKETPIVEGITFTDNENLLHNVLVNNFNVLYGNTLDENEKKELSKILSISDEDLKTNFESLQEEVTTKMNEILSEEKNTDLKLKLGTALSEATCMKPSKYNYYKLQQLKSGL